MLLRDQNVTHKSRSKGLGELRKGECHNIDRVRFSMLIPRLTSEVANPSKPNFVKAKSIFMKFLPYVWLLLKSTL